MPKFNSCPVSQELSVLLRMGERKPNT
uniref:Uncharacterized protein n=1 Tax=Anguilla anguilla TaxID=7936 RepID=A0A0E9TKH6_ANGAN